MHAHAPCDNKPETRTVCIRSGKRLIFFHQPFAMGQQQRRSIIWGETLQPVMLLPGCMAEAVGEGLKLCVGDAEGKKQEGSNEGWMREVGILFPPLTLKSPSASGKPFRAAASVSPLAMPGSAFCREGEAVEQWLAPATLTAGDVQQVTVHRWHPEVGGPSVEDHSELLWGSPNADLAVILGLQRRRREP